MASYSLRVSASVVIGLGSFAGAAFQRWGQTRLKSKCFGCRDVEEEFEECVLPHFVLGTSGPLPKLSLHAIFNYILRLLYMGCHWEQLPIEKDVNGQPEIHCTRIYRMFRFWEAEGCFEAIFTASVWILHCMGLLDTRIVHGDGTTTAAKKGGDNIGFSGHKNERR